jgi:isopentenyl-diphosphate delta-isomerase
MKTPNIKGSSEANDSVISKRKLDHLDLCTTDDVAFRQRGTLLDNVQLVHQALPELRLNEIDLSVELLGKRLRAPLIIAGMTGGTERATRINHELASVAEQFGYGFGLGSQRAMQRMPDTAASYQVRTQAPTTLLLGNIGVMQARDLPTPDIQSLVDQVGADALCVHMNPAMELIQDTGDRDFTGAIDTFRRLATELRVPVVAKETGNGISERAARALRACGVTTVDVSGAGGTSWVGVETLRAKGDAQSLGELLWDWGIPTAVSIAWCGGAGLQAIATGGIRHGRDVVAALSLGATAAGVARPVLQAFEQGGADAVVRLLQNVEQQLRAIMLLCGAGNIKALQTAPKVITGELREWLA